MSWNSDEEQVLVSFTTKLFIPLRKIEVSSLKSMRRSSRTAPLPRVPYRIQTLFHSVDGIPVIPTKFEKVHDQPNVYLIRDFLSESELQYFNQICSNYGNTFHASFTEDEENNRVISEERTSMYIHLSKAQDKHVRDIERKASDLVGLLASNVEPLQIVSYQKGQKFNVHHDAGTLLDDGKVDLVYPRRLVTFFVYLNNLPEGQGQTVFPILDLKVTPTRGCAVVFCNVRADGELDERTVHAALPVHGDLQKFGINIWIGDTDLQSLAHDKPQLVVKMNVAPKEDKCVESDKVKNYVIPTSADSRKRGRSGNGTASALTHAERMTELFQAKQKLQRQLQHSEGKEEYHWSQAAHTEVVAEDDIKEVEEEEEEEEEEEKQEESTQIKGALDHESERIEKSRSSSNLLPVATAGVTCSNSNHLLCHKRKFEQ